MSAPGYNVRRFGSAQEMLAAVEEFLLRKEASNNLMLSILENLLHSNAGFDDPILMAAVYAGNTAEPVGCMLRTPPHKLLLSTMPEAALPAVMDMVSNVYDSIPAILARDPLALHAAEAWCARKNGVVRAGMRQRLYRLDRVVPPAKPAPGELRVATRDDVPLVQEWSVAFNTEVGVHGYARASIEERVLRGSFFLWWDDVPVSMCAWAGRTRHGVRIGYVYTPAEYRGAGYASSSVAEATARALGDGSDFAFLYTDLDNATSNAIYSQIGYEPVEDWIDALIIT